MRSRSAEKSVTTRAGILEVDSAQRGSPGPAWALCAFLGRLSARPSGLAYRRDLFPGPSERPALQAVTGPYLPLQTCTPGLMLGHVEGMHGGCTREDVQGGCTGQGRVPEVTKVTKRAILAVLARVTKVKNRTLRKVACRSVFSSHLFDRLDLPAGQNINDHRS